MDVKTTKRREWMLKRQNGGYGLTAVRADESPLYFFAQKNFIWFLRHGGFRVSRVEDRADARRKILRLASGGALLLSRNTW